MYVFLMFNVIFLQDQENQLKQLWTTLNNSYNRTT